MRFTISTDQHTIRASQLFSQSPRPAEPMAANVVACTLRLVALTSADWGVGDIADEVLHVVMCKGRDETGIDATAAHCRQRGIASQVELDTVAERLTEGGDGH